MKVIVLSAGLACLLASAGQPAHAAENLLADPSFEQPKAKDRFGLIFEKWGGWRYEGDCDFAVGKVARTGDHSCLLVGGTEPKIRTVQLLDLAPGRYRITAYLRGLDVGTGKWKQTTEFMFDGKYGQLNKNGTFGWTKLTYVAELKERKKAGPSFGLMAPGRLWVDDVSLERVGPGVPLTPVPVLGKEESPIAPPGRLSPGALRCAECATRNMPVWKRCYACGTRLVGSEALATGPRVKPITSFETRSPFHGGTVVEQHATDGAKALRIDRSYVDMAGHQDWSGYDYLKADLYTDATGPLKLYVEVRDRDTKDYWTRVNYNTVAPPGRSTLIVPIRQLYVGEKSRPGRMLLRDGITRLVFNIGKAPPAPLFVDNVRLERDDSDRSVVFDGLSAFDFGLSASPLMKGFRRITPTTRYSVGRGYGLKDARLWRSFDALQPDPLYQDFLCIERGGLAVDVPNGRYRVWMNIDSPSGFWGEYQVYRRRTVRAEGRDAVAETQAFDAFQRKYFRFWNVEDLPSDDTFDKYQRVYFDEKLFDVDVRDGRLNLEFEGENWACCVSAVVVFPVARADEGEAFLKYVEKQRRFHFNNYFKRTLHRASGAPLQPTPEDRKRGYMVFSRDYMRDVYYNDTPAAGEVGRPLRAEAFAGEYEPLTLSLLPLRDLGQVTVSAGPLRAANGTIPADAIDVGFVSYRVSRVTMEGSVYTIAPRMIMPTNTVAMPRGMARRFWLTVKTPTDARSGMYRGTLLVSMDGREATELPVECRVRAGALDPLDVPVGPWGHAVRVPWPASDAAAASFNRNMRDRSLRKMREYGLTACSGIPAIAYRGVRDGKPVLDFGRSDEDMRRLRELGFLSVVSYGRGVSGFNAYFRDENKMREAGFSNYASFVKAVYSAVQEHASREGWLPVYYNLGDEPIGDALTRSAENAEAYREAFPAGPPTFTAASSFRGRDRDDPHFRLSRAVHVANWNIHDEDAVQTLQDIGGAWAFYNGANRWTFGTYMYKAVKQFDMKFRLAWHWNCVAGDPYYALDCREDDYAWCNSTPDGRLVPSVHFERLREGVDDYRRLLTLARLAKEHAGTPAAQAAETLIADRMAAFRLGQRNHDALFGPDDWIAFRAQVDNAIEALRQ